jgi:hypothetical protein
MSVTGIMKDKYTISHPVLNLKSHEQRSLKEVIKPSKKRCLSVEWYGTQGQHEEEQTGSQHMHNPFPFAASLSDRCTTLSIRKQTNVSVTII